jgi:hypothetical protein
VIEIQNPIILTDQPKNSPASSDNASKLSVRHSQHRRAIYHAKRLRKLLFKAYFSCANPSL